MGRAVFLCYHGIGHFNACFRMAKVLQQDHDVVFAGHEYFQDYVGRQDFQYYPLKTVPFGLGFETWANTIEKKKFIYWNSLKDRWTNRRFNLRERELTQLIDETAPDYLFIDSSQSTDLIALYPLLKKRRIRTLIVHTTLSPVMEPDLPPLNSLSLPGGANLRKARTIFFLKRRARATSQWLRYFGRNDQYLVRAGIRRNKFPAKYLSLKPALFSINFENIHQLVMAPAEFELPSRKRSPFHHYLGFMLDASRKENADPSFHSCMKAIQRKILNGKTLIYCSFGTVETKYTQRLKAFVKNLALALGDSNYILLVGGNSFDVLQKLQPPGEIYFFREVPQLQVLEHAALFFIFFGWNSIKEGIRSQVPLLVYPLDSRTDQPGISTRVVYHGLGLRGAMNEDSPRVIRSRIDTLISDPIYKQKIKEMISYGKAYSDEAFLSVLRTTPPMD